MKKDVVYIVAFIILAVFSFKKYEKLKDAEGVIERANYNKEVVNDSVQFYKNKYGQEVATKRSFLVASKEEIAKLSNDNKNLKYLVKKYKKIASAGTIKTVTKIPETVIKFDNEISCSAPTKDNELEFSTGSNLGVIRKDFEISFNRDFEYFSISGTIRDSEFELSCLEVPTTIDFVLGEENLGMFKSKFSLTAISSNPYVKIDDKNSYQFITKQKRWNISASIFVAINGTINAGVGIGYSLFSF